MSEVLEMVTRVVESSVSTNLQPPLKSVASAEASQAAEIKNKKVTKDQNPDCNWLRMWRPKLLRALDCCSFKV